MPLQKDPKFSHLCLRYRDPDGRSHLVEIDDQLVENAAPSRREVLALADVLDERLAAL
ncbi:hypothetical protein GRI75_10580 [Altererythrobacter soli]|uniref:Uncharacterized protein n=1 Tax=Croceibacterium soli TaxID=1739690 RepID=A0A6I4UYV9_9SPHN|nr:hypothetical protein [Croceibacterium soli]MXP42085.1 hypothetical protein [Croceibacterium soli]